MSLSRHRIVLIIVLGLSLTVVGFAGAVQRRPEPTEPTPDSSDPLEAPWRELRALDSRDAGR